MKNKKFIFTAPFQQKDVGLHKVNYKSVDNDLLKTDLETSFPILVAINGYVKPNDNIDIIIIKPDYVNTNESIILFKEQLEQLSKKICFNYNINMLNMEYDESLDVLLVLFKDLITNINDDEDIFACITYGTKPIPFIQIMALNYAYKIRKNTDVVCIVYGAYDHFNKTSRITDVTPLFYMDAIINEMSKLKLNNTNDKIITLLENELKG